MTPEQIALILILSSILILFILNYLRYDAVAVLGLLAAISSGVIPIQHAFTGFSHPATLTVIFVLIISYTLSETGAVERISKLIIPMMTTPLSHISILCTVSCLLSMFMNNIGALALLLPIAIESAQKTKRALSVLLMPISFASILGGMVTLIGTPPNIIIANYRATAVNEPFTMFDFTPVGGLVALTGILFIISVGWRLLPQHKSAGKAGEEIFEIESYTFELKLSDKSNIIEQNIDQVETTINQLEVAIVSLIRKKQRYYVIPSKITFEADDVLIVEGAHQEIDKLVSMLNLQYIDAKEDIAEILHSQDSDTMEVVIGPMSNLEGRQIGKLRMKKKYNVNILAVSRQGRPLRGRIKDFKLRVGDVILLHGEKQDLIETIQATQSYPLRERGVSLGKRHLAFKALLIFSISILLVLFDICPVHVALLGSILLLVMANILALKDIYRGIDWSIIVLLGALMPIGQAMESTGTTNIIVSFFLNSASTAPVPLLLCIIIIITMLISDILNNAATAIIMAPIAAEVASITHSNTDTFLMAVAIGASCAFLTPIGHQNNALVMGPAGYRFSDYWKMGLPLQFLVLLTSIPALIWFWPLT